MKVYESENEELAAEILDQTFEGKLNQIQCEQCKRKIVMIKPCLVTECREISQGVRVRKERVEDYRSRFQENDWMRLEEGRFIKYISKQ